MIGRPCVAWRGAVPCAGVGDDRSAVRGAARRGARASAASIGRAYDAYERSHLDQRVRDDQAEGRREAWNPRHSGLPEAYAAPDPTEIDPISNCHL
jgi:hypothetical protein